MPEEERKAKRRKQAHASKRYARGSVRAMRAADATEAAAAEPPAKLPEPAAESVAEPASEPPDFELFNEWLTVLV